jgi:hypothetical protein
VYCTESLLWKPIQGTHPIKLLTPKLEVGFSSIEIDSSTNREVIYTFLLNKREQIRRVLSVKPLDDIGGIEMNTKCPLFVVKRVYSTNSH